MRISRRQALAAGAAVAVVTTGIVLLASRDRAGTAALVPLGTPPRATASHSPSPTPTPSEETPVIDEATPSPRPGPEGQAATPDPPRPAGYALPTHCLSFGHACAYDGATGAVTGGVTSFSAKRVGATSVRLAWTSTYWSSSGGPATEFVVNAYRPPYDHETGPRDPSRLRRVRLPASVRSYTFDGLTPGESYEFWVQELNSSGLSAGMGVDAVTIPAPSPSPTKPAPTTPPPTPSPTPTPTPSATPSETPTATATATP